MFINHHTAPSTDISKHLRSVFEEENFSTKAEAYKIFWDTSPHYKAIPLPRPAESEHSPLHNKTCLFSPPEINLFWGTNLRATLDWVVDQYVKRLPR